jgi:transcriptional regulator of acetoin/glycerol metabolism
VERSAIEKALNKYEGNISKAAKELGLTRASLYRRLEKYGI